MYEAQSWTSATRPPSSAPTTSTRAASTRAACASSATPRRPRTSSRTSSCKLWRDPRKFDARRGELGSYLRLMARSRALDLWREGQAAGRASDRLKLVVAPRRGARRGAPRRRRRARGRAARRVRDALGGCPTPQREAVVLAYWGGLTADQIARRSGVPLGHGQEPHPPRAGRLRARVRGRAVAPAPSVARLACSLRRGGARQRQRRSTRACCPSTSTGASRSAQDDWFDAHTHIGQNDPDGRKATAEEILGGLDAAGHQRALLFAMHEPDGYPAANDAVLAAARRLRRAAACRSRASRPNAEDAVAEARRCLDAGARGLQAAPALGRLRRCRTRSSRRSSRWPTSARAPVLFHAGRGHPAPRRGRRRPRAPLPGRAADPRPRGHQRPRLDRRRRGRAAEPVLRHRVVERRRPAAALRDDPARAGSSTPATCPTRPGLLAALRLPARARARSGYGRERRCARSPAAQLARVVAGEEPARRSGPAPGPDAVGRRVIEAERVVTYCAAGAAGRLPRHGPDRADRAGARWRAGPAATATSARC